MEWYFWLILAVLYVIIGIFVFFFDLILISFSENLPQEENLIDFDSLLHIFIWPLSLILTIVIVICDFFSKIIKELNLSYKIRVNGWKIKFYR